MLPKRIWAMMGLIYVLITFGLVTYWIANTRLISGTPGLLLFPAAGAFSAQFLNRAWLMRRGRFDPVDETISDEDDACPRFSGTRYVVLGVLSAALCVGLLIWGIFDLTRFFAAG